MCLIVFDWQPGQRLLLAANRDEYYARPTAAMHIWPQHPDIVAGQDLQQGGSWLGVTRQGRIAMLTNVRLAGKTPADALSRGALVRDYLLSSRTAADYLRSIELDRYGPFNLICGSLQQLYYLSNAGQSEPQPIYAGIHAVSNAQLNSPWPKAELAKQQLAHFNGEELPLALLNRRQPFADELLPDTGVDPTLEKQLSAQHIHIPAVYGTRCATALELTPQQIKIAEQSFDSKARPSHRCSWQWTIR